MSRCGSLRAASTIGRVLVPGVGAVLRHAMPCFRKDHSDIVNTCILCPALERRGYVRFGDVRSSVSVGVFFFFDTEWGCWLWVALRLKIVRYNVVRVPERCFRTGRGLIRLLTYRRSTARWPSAGCLCSPAARTGFRICA